MFICCLVNSEKIEWIGRKTTYNNLIKLLENKITIRDAFLNITNEKMLIEYNGEKVTCNIKEASELPEEMLPTKGEYMDAEEGEFDEKIFQFQKRNLNTEYVIKARSSKWVIFQHKSTLPLRNDKEIDWGNGDILEYRLEKIKSQKIALS